MQIKAVQLDLARQKENLPFIFSFVDFIKKYKFNTLVLYLEGRVRTASFPFPSTADSYSEQEVMEIVKYCRIRDIDVIPVVPSLSHTEMFLQYPELKPLAELYPDKSGRFSSHLDMCCPEREETYRFFSGYYAEIAALFPGKYFHVGADESWNIGFCPACRERIRRERKGDGIFRDYLIRIHKVLETNGKRMLMWDDMFEIYPEALDGIPRNIILCQWYYVDNNDYPRNHFLHHRRHEVFAEYKRLGMDFLVGPSTRLGGNIIGMTHYARKYGAIGQILTMWGRSTSFYYRSYPLISFAGRLWSEPPMDPAGETGLLVKTVQEVTEGTPAQAAELSRLFNSNSERATSYPVSSEYFTGEIHQMELQNSQFLGMFETILADLPENRVNVDLRLSLQTRQLLFRFREKFYNYYRYPEFRDTLSDQLDELFLELDGLRQARLAQWRESRNGINDTRMADYFNKLSEAAKGLRKAIDNAAYFLHVRYILPDCYGYPSTSITVEDSNGMKHQVVKRRVFKSQMMEAVAYYEYIYPLPLSEAPRAVEISVCGHGGQGLVYLKVAGRKGDLVPSAIEGGKGVVSNPLHIMADDLRWCYIGPHDAETGFIHLDEPEIIHSLKISLKEQKVL